MIRPVLTELALFLAPFAIYALYLWGTRADVIHPESWPLPTLAWLTAAALLLMAGSFIVLAQWGGGRRSELSLAQGKAAGRAARGPRPRRRGGTRGRRRGAQCAARVAARRH